MLSHPSEPASLAATVGSGATARLRDGVAALARRLAPARRAAAHRRAARALREIEPHLLRDIGLTQADLRRAIHGRDG